MNKRKLEDTPKEEWRVRVARYTGSTKPPAKSFDDYNNILIHVNDPLSPYVVRNDKGHILENIWQSAKLYPQVTAQRIAKHVMRPNDIVWEHPAETHIISRKPLTVSPLYWAWREKMCKANYAVRYPNGYHGRHNVVGALWPAKETDVLTDENSTVGPDGVTYILLPYIEARKRIYCGLYAELTRDDKEWCRLVDLLKSGEKLQIWEVDGPGLWPEPPFNKLRDCNIGLEAHKIEDVLL